MLIVQEDGTKLALDPSTISAVSLSVHYSHTGNPHAKTPEPQWTVRICAVVPDQFTGQLGYTHALVYTDRVEAETCFDRVAKASNINIDV